MNKNSEKTEKPLIFDDPYLVVFEVELLRIVHGLYDFVLQETEEGHIILKDGKPLTEREYKELNSKEIL